MNVPRLLLAFILTQASLHNLEAQQSSISLKVGVTRILNAPSPSAKGFAYKTIAPHSPYPDFHLEFRREKFFNERLSLLAGISGIPTFGEITLNEKNIKAGYSSAARISYYSLQLYAGIEWSLRNSKKESFRNYFSLFSTVGFNLSAGENLNPQKLYDNGVTYNGEIFSGGSYTIEQAKLFSPSLQAGIRYHIMNRKGNEILILELLMNYNLSRYFSYTFHYKINGNDRVDFVAEKGFNIQLNVIVPLFNSKKTHKK